MAWFAVKCILRLKKKKVYSDDKKRFWNKAPPAICWNYKNAVFHLIQQPARQRALKPIQRCLLYLRQFRCCRKSRTQEQWRFTEELEKQWKERNFMLWCNNYFYTVLKIIQLYIFLGFPDGLVGKESTCNAGDPSSILGLGRSPGEGNGYPLQYSGESHGLYSPWGLQRVGHDWATLTVIYILFFF